MSHKQQILAHLKRGPITQRQAASNYQCWRLASVIERLRTDGYPISTQMVKNRDGTGRHARYWLMEGRK